MQRKGPSARGFRVFDSVRALHADAARPRFRFAAEQGTVARGEPPAVSCQYEAGKGGLLRGNRRRGRGWRSRSGHADVNELAHRHRLLVNYCLDHFGPKSMPGHWDSWTGERRQDGGCRTVPTRMHARTHARTETVYKDRYCIHTSAGYLHQLAGRQPKGCKKEPVDKEANAQRAGSLTAATEEFRP